MIDDAPGRVHHAEASGRRRESTRRRRRSASRSCRRTSPRARAPSRRTRVGVAPRRARVEQPSVDARHRTGTSKPNTSSVRNSTSSSSPDERGAQHRARRVDRHALALAERPAGPAGVDEPHLRAVRVELLAEQARVDRRRLRQERLAEAGRERGLRLGDADLGAGELGGEAREEEVERLLAREPRDRRQDPERVGGEQDDRTRVARLLRPAARSRSARACTRRACSRSSSRRRDRACRARRR